MEKLRPPTYSQVDPRWKRISYGSDTIGYAGCGLCAMASAVSGLTGRPVLPTDMKTIAEQTHDKVAAGTSWAFFAHATVRYPGLNCTQTMDFSAVLTALKSRNSYVISSMKPGHFTSRGHFILLWGVDAAGGILVNDSAGMVGAARGRRAWSQDIIRAEAKQHWIVSRKDQV